MLVAIHGISRSGKDTVAGILTRKYGFKRWAFADSLRYVLGNILREVRPDIYWYIVEGGWDLAKEPFPEVVGGMIALGAGMRELDPDVWVRYMPEWVKDADNKVVISDLRHPNEFEAVLEHGGQVWKILRPGFEPKGMDTLLDGVPDFDWDYIIHNTGTLKELEEIIDTIMTDLLYQEELLWLRTLTPLNKK